MIWALVLMGGAMIVGAYDGIQKDFEVKGIYGPEIFGFNKKSHPIQTALILLGSLLAAWICTFM